MRIQQFQVSLVEKTRAQLPRARQNFKARAFFTLVKIFYARPKIHYEVWVRGKEHLIEIGLHCEADKATNDALLVFFHAHGIEIFAELGARIEIEQWTTAWSRVHEVVPYETLDADLVDALAHKLARMISVLEPMLDAYWKSNGKSKRAPKSRAQK
ncbi:MAG: hypothetical protein HZC40_04495 [Chloroflexi bacterium]|nr:hypothetical protein [Chloroflexota bacterium]